MILYTLADWFFPNAQTPLVIRCCHPRLLISNISGATSVHLNSASWNLLSFEEELTHAHFTRNALASEIFSLEKGFTHTHFTRNARVGNILSRKVTRADTPPKTHDRRHLCIWKESICKGMSGGNIAWLPPSPHSVWIKSIAWRHCDIYKGSRYPGIRSKSDIQYI